MELYLKKNRVFYFDGEEVIANSGLSYEISNWLGSGGNGVVYECIDQSGILYAIKFLLHFTEKSKKRFRQEISLMKRLHHPHIIKYIDDGSVILKENKHSTQEQQALFVIMEKADKNLKDFLFQSSILQTARIYSYASGKIHGWRSAVRLHCKFNRCAV